MLAECGFSAFAFYGQSAQRRMTFSLEESAESPEEIEKLWIAEAGRRFQELRNGLVQGLPAGEVFTELRKKKA